MLNKALHLCLFKSVSQVFHIRSMAYASHGQFCILVCVVQRIILVDQRLRVARVSAAPVRCVLCAPLRATKER